MPESSNSTWGIRDASTAGAKSLSSNNEEENLGKIIMGYTYQGLPFLIALNAASIERFDKLAEKTTAKEINQIANILSELPASKNLENFPALMKSIQKLLSGEQEDFFLGKQGGFVSGKNNDNQISFALVYQSDQDDSLHCAGFNDTCTKIEITGAEIAVNSSFNIPVEANNTITGYTEPNLSRQDFVSIPNATEQAELIALNQLKIIREQIEQYEWRVSGCFGGKAVRLNGANRTRIPTHAAQVYRIINQYIEIGGYTDPNGQFKTDSLSILDKTQTIFSAALQTTPSHCLGNFSFFSQRAESTKTFYKYHETSAGSRFELT